LLFSGTQILNRFKTSLPIPDVPPDRDTSKHTAARRSSAQHAVRCCTVAIAAPSR